MPFVIDVDDSNNDSLAATIVTSQNGSAKTRRTNRPEFTPQNTFHKEITGMGKKSGRIHAGLTPARTDLAYTPNLTSLVKNHKVTNGDITLRYIPTSTPSRGVYALLSKLSPNVFTLQDNLSGPEGVDSALELTDYVFATGDYTFWYDLTPQSLVLRKTKVMDNSGQNIITNSTHVEYRVEILAVHNDDLDQTTGLPADETYPVIFDGFGVRASQLPGRNILYTGFSYDPINDMAGMLTDLENLIRPLSSTQVNLRILDPTEVEDYYNDPELYSLYDRLCHQAKIVRTDAMVTRINDLIDQFFGSIQPSGNADSNLVNAMAYELRRMDGYDIPLSTYSDIYNHIKTLANQDIATMLVKQNMQLNLNRNLQDLAAKRSQLATPPHGPVNHTIDPRYSKQQVDAITTDEPLVIAQAGAGTGKSTVINERMKYLAACGVDPSTIMVLSFTNAAADHIKELNPNVISMTIAKMIHEVYSHNYPRQKISTIDTILNSIPIYYGDQAQTSQFLVVFAKLLKEALFDSSNATMTRLSVFIERYTDEVIEVLETLQQSSLELEIIISYLKINDPNFTEPFDSPDYLIIDEVQDNSSFEFVYSLKYAAKHNTALYLVGDSSQTLYEFRAANPKALNALEASGVFTAYRLTTNYRSNQEILDFANSHLMDIEANQFAKIQLRANSLSQPTADSFQDKVRIVEVPDCNKKQFTESIPTTFASKEITDFIERNLNAGEPTAVLAATRREVKYVEEYLTSRWPNQPVANLVSERPFNSTTFSAYVGQYWDEVTAVDPASAAYVFTRQINAHLSEIDPQAAKYPARFDARLKEWWSENAMDITALVNKYSLTPNDPAAREEFFDALRENILAFEIDRNSVLQSLVNQRNQRRKEEQAKQNPLLMVSTIHGVKGLEFDHTIVLKAPSSGRPAGEDTKRQYYVALTRAKKSEIIVVGSGKSTKPRIITDYEAMVEALEQRDAAQLAAANAAAIAAAGEGSSDSDTVADPVGPQEATDPVGVDALTQAEPEGDTDTDK